MSFLDHIKCPCHLTEKRYSTLFHTQYDKVNSGIANYALAQGVYKCSIAHDSIVYVHSVIHLQWGTTTEQMTRHKYFQPGKKLLLKYQQSSVTVLVQK